MTKAAIKQICKDLKLYSTPSCNDKLYLHYKGYQRIENLDEYVNVKVIWLEGNGLTKIEGLEHCTKLRTLYLQENLIEQIENLDTLVELDTLNLSANSVKCISNLSMLPNLQTLQLKGNYLKSADDVRHVLQCPSISVLDIQHNRIDDPEILEIVAAMPALRVLYLQGNDVVKKIRHYRKTLVARCKTLKYLDDRPVFDDERLRCEAWWAGGGKEGKVEAALEAERAEIARQKQEKKDQEAANFRSFDEMVRKARIAAAEKEAKLKQVLDKENTAAINIFSGEAILPTYESPELKEMREARWRDILPENVPLTKSIFRDDQLPKPPDATEKARLREVVSTVGDGTYTQRDINARTVQKQHENSQHQAPSAPAIMLPPDAPNDDSTNSLNASLQHSDPNLPPPRVPSPEETLPPPAPAANSLSARSSLMPPPPPPVQVPSVSTLDIAENAHPPCGPEVDIKKSDDFTDMEELD